MAGKGLPSACSREMAAGQGLPPHDGHGPAAAAAPSARVCAFQQHLVPAFGNGAAGHQSAGAVRAGYLDPVRVVQTATHGIPHPVQRWLLVPCWAAIALCDASRVRQKGACVESAAANVLSAKVGPAAHQPAPWMTRLPAGSLPLDVPDGSCPAGNLPPLWLALCGRVGHCIKASLLHRGKVSCRSLRLRCLCAAMQ